MPIHQTKLMMSNAHPTGTLLPQIPIPVKSRFAMVMLRTISSRKAMKNPKNQPMPVRLLRTAWLIVSVTLSNVWPGAMTAGVRWRSAAVAAASPAAIWGFDFSEGPAI